MGKEGTRGVYARRDAEPKTDDFRTRANEYAERWTGRRVALGCDDFWHKRNLAINHIPPGSWRFEEEQVARRWVRKPQPPLDKAPMLPPVEPYYQTLKRQWREREDAEALRRELDAQYKRELAHIDFERRLLACKARRRAAALDAAQANVAQSSGTPE